MIATAHRARVGVALCATVGIALAGARAQPAPTEPGPAAPAAAAPLPGESPAIQPTSPPAATLKASPTEPQEVTLYLKDGQRVTGLLVGANSEDLVVRISGINTRFQTATVDRYEVLPPIIERYLTLRATIGDDVDQILRLASWLQAREKYPLALTEVDRALVLKPESGEARRMKLLLEQQILLRSRAQTPKPAEEVPDESAAEADGDPGAPPPSGFPLLTADQIALMKVYEVDLRSNPRVLIPRGAVLRMFEEHAGHPLVPVTKEGREAILRKRPAEILDLMFRLQARNLYPQVVVRDNPRPVALFRENVQRKWLMNGCATTQCHGGTEAGRLALSNRYPNADPSVYTNLYILQHYRLNDGTPLINWEDPAKSPLLQMGLPREDSLFPHPIVLRGVAGRDAWDHEFRSTEDQRFRQSVDWMRSVYRPRPDYGIQYTPLAPFEPTPVAQKPGATPAAPSGESGEGDGQSRPQREPPGR